MSLPKVAIGIWRTNSIWLGSSARRQENIMRPGGSLDLVEFGRRLQSWLVSWSEGGACGGVGRLDIGELVSALTPPIRASRISIIYGEGTW